jgi:hypothetical protein
MARMHSKVKTSRRLRRPIRRSYDLSTFLQFKVRLVARLLLEESTAVTHRPTPLFLFSTFQLLPDLNFQARSLTLIHILGNLLSLDQRAAWATKARTPVPTSAKSFPAFDLPFFNSTADFPSSRLFAIGWVLNLSPKVGREVLQRLINPYRPG